MPQDHRTRYESMLFNYETTGRTDYNLKEIECPIRTVYKAKRSHARAAPKPLKDITTLVDKQGPAIPFDLLWSSPKDIVRTDPRNLQQPHEKLEDLGREEARRTRPRVFICPIVSLDDIEDDDTRNLALNETYKTTTQTAMEDVVSRCHHKNVRAPFPGPYSRPRPLVLGKCNPQQVSPEWRMESAAWNGSQLRTYLEPKRAFWFWKLAK